MNTSYHFHYQADQEVLALLLAFYASSFYCPAQPTHLRHIIQTFMHRSELLPQPRPQNIKNSSGLSDKSKELSKSSVSSKCLTTEETLQGQIVQLKEKAHQSFMQVIQMQQLHEEELELLRTQFAQKQAEYQSKQAEYKAKEEDHKAREEEHKAREEEYKAREEEYKSRVQQLQSRVRQQQQLQLRVKQLEYQNTTLEKNYKHHNCDFDQDELEIDNIELITCREESKLDDSAIINFTEIINLNRHEEQMRCVREEIRKEVETLAHQPYAETSLSNMVEKLFQYISFVRAELLRAQEKALERERESAESQNSKFYESLQKETKFMTEHIKRLSGEKLKLQKRLVEMQRQGKAEQERLRRIEASLARRGIKMEQVAPKSPSPAPEDAEKSLEINEFISQTFKNTNPTHKAHYGLIRKTNH